MKTSSQTKLTLILLCWFFGLFGVHRFYSGKPLTGSVQLAALLLFGLCAVLDLGMITAVFLVGLFVSIIVDALLILMGRFTDRDGRRIAQWV